MSEHQRPHDGPEGPPPHDGPVTYQAPPHHGDVAARQPYPPAGPPAPERWAVPVPEGLPYHLLARNAVNQWWRPLVGTALIIGLALAMMTAGGVVFAISTIVAGAAPEDLSSVDGITEKYPLAFLGFNLASLAVLIPIVLLAVWLVQRRRPGTVSSVAGRLRWRWMLTCSGAALIAVLAGQVALAVAMFASGEPADLFGWIGWDDFLPALILIICLVPFQAAAEEYAFRGWVLQAFGAYIRSPWPAILLGAVGFTALHAYTDWGIVDVFLTGALLGWLSVRTGGLEAGIALHVVNNLGAFLIAAAAGELRDALKQGEMPWQILPASLIQLAVFACLVVLLARRRVRTTS